MRQKGFAPILIVLVILGTLVLIPFIGSKLYPPREGKIIVGTAKPQPTPISTPELTPSQYWANQYKNNKENTFISQRLGISFRYLSGYIVTEKGNKVYINNEDPPEKGQWVEVFNKNPNESLNEAIQNQILSMFPESKCKVYAKTYDTLYGPGDLVDQGFIKNDYVFAIIDFETPPDSLPFEDDLVKSKCPVGYTQSNFLAYFLMDPTHPSKYLFFRIGQYSIPAKTGPWEQTIEIIN